ncbi:MAG: hypothetical protein K0S08_1473 [Gammaproteobacteria bacterium]|jgi:hypothetical protein|nr:hypothetical protein [Gammaproteobacteria bacterium]
MARLWVWLRRKLVSCASQYKFSPLPPSSLNQAACGAFGHSVRAACAGDYCRAANGDCYGNFCVSTKGNCYGMGCSTQKGKVYSLQYPSWCPNPPGNDYAECLINCKLALLLNS